MGQDPESPEHEPPDFDGQHYFITGGVSTKG